jgi:adenylosuccinate lyase
MTLVHSHILWKDWFGTDEIRSVWSEVNTVSQWMKAEAALARIQADEGIIPDAAAERIAQTEITEDVITDIRQITQKTRHVIAGFVKYMRKRLEPAGEFFHLGATTQDILETVSRCRSVKA